jgi:hypothetical protein
MSVFATLLCMDSVCNDGHPDDPGPPFAYAGSHLLPDVDGAERGGYLEIAGIPSYVTEPPALHDWVRLSINDADVLLDRAMVERVRHVLTEWLQRGTDV